MSVGKTLGNHGSNDYVFLRGVHKILTRIYSYNISLAHIIVVTVHVEKVMTIVLCESAQLF